MAADGRDSLINMPFYALETGKAFLDDRAALQHFLRIGQFLDLSPNPILNWAWIKATGRKLNLTFEEWLDNPEQRIHPLLLVEKIPPASKLHTGLEYYQYLSRLRVGEAPLATTVRKMLGGNLAEDLSEFLPPFTHRTKTTKYPDNLLFSHDWYYFAYRDIERAKLNAFTHYVVSGWREGRDPSPNFSTLGYLELHSDVKDSRTDPLTHYLNFGQAESRSIRDTQNVDSVVRYSVARGLGPPSFVNAFESAPKFLTDAAEHFVASKMIITIPFFENSELVELVLGSLATIAQELEFTGVGILCINDSPGHDLLQKQLEKWAAIISESGITIAVVANSLNRGFIYSTNLGVYISRSNGSACMFLNSDTYVSSGAITEIISIAETDDKIGFVCPKSNNATIATFGDRPTPDWQECYRRFMNISPQMPRAHPIPTGVGFCLYLSNAVIRDVGFLDPIYGMGYNEENDYILRANRLGYIAVIANRAFVAHIGEQSFSLLSAGRSEREDKNAEILRRRYPEYVPSIERYFSSVYERTRRVVEGCIDNYDILLDLSDVAPLANGTTRLIMSIAPHIFAEAEGLRFAITGTRALLEAMELEKYPNVDVVTPSESWGARVGLRLLQPFSEGPVNLLSERCAFVGFFFLDTISTDCLYLQDSGLRELWQAIFDYCDFAVFNSEYTKAKFESRFSVPPNFRGMASYHSLSPTEYLYGTKPRREPRADRHNSIGQPMRPNVLIIGNDFCHKGMRHVHQFIDRNEFAITNFGCDLEIPGTDSVSAGELPQAALDNLFALAHCIVFPTFFEGFGFPVLEAYARCRPVVVHENALFRDIWHRIGCPTSILFFSDFNDLNATIRLALSADLVAVDPFETASAVTDGWRRSASEIVGFLESISAQSVDFERVRRRISKFC